MAAKLVLEPVFEADFMPCSYGFRPKRGTLMALESLRKIGTKSHYVLDADICNYFDSLDHEVLLSILREKIHDNRFLRLINGLLRAGYLEDWRYNATLSGSPQGAVLSPILSNIYLDKLDQFVVGSLLPRYTRGNRRRPNPVWQPLQEEAKKLRKFGKPDEANQVRRQMQQVPSLDPTDSDYRRLRYIRYADDWLLGFVGPRSEAEEIKGEIARFLRDHLKLELSATKTLITHARSSAARFLGYRVTTLHNDHKLDRRGHRCINGNIALRVPGDVVLAKCARYLRHGKPMHRPELLHDSPFSIVARYQQEYRGIVEYYRLALNLGQLNRLKWLMERSLTQTLAHKLRISVRAVYRRYRRIVNTGIGSSPVLQVSVERAEGKKPLVARWGGISLARDIKAVLNDAPLKICGPRTELERRLLANQCELCGSHPEDPSPPRSSPEGSAGQRTRRKALLGTNHGGSKAEDACDMREMSRWHPRWQVARNCRRRWNITALESRVLREA